MSDSRLVDRGIMVPKLLPVVKMRGDGSKRQVDMFFEVERLENDLSSLVAIENKLEAGSHGDILDLPDVFYLVRFDIFMPCAYIEGRHQGHQATVMSETETPLYLA